MTSRLVFGTALPRGTLLTYSLIALVRRLGSNAVEMLKLNTGVQTYTQPFHLLSFLLTCCFVACGAENSDQETDTGLLDTQQSASHEEPQALQQAPQPIDGEALLQVPVVETSEWNAEDLSVPQIYVPEKHREFVLAGAKKLLEDAVIDADPATALHLAQSALLSVAEADVVVLAEVVAESKYADESVQKLVTMSTVDLVKGEIGAKWSLDFPTVAGPCGARSPAIGAQAVFFLRNIDGKLRLHAEQSIRPLRDGKVSGFPGLLPSVSEFKAAYIAGKEAQL